MSGLLIVAILIVLLLLRVPLFVVIGIATVAGYVLGGESGDPFKAPLMEEIRRLTDKPPLLAIPFFVLSGTIMSRGAISSRLVDVAKAFVGFVPGGLGVATVGACMFFAAISGSSPVTVITIGSVMYPALMKQGYSDRFSTGLVTSAGTLGILIPPSIPMIVYAIFAGGIQIESFFLAGVGPGILIGLLLGGYCVVTGKLRGESLTRPSAAVIKEALGEGVWAILLPFVILGGIYSGIFTATEAAAVSVVYALVIEVFVHRQLQLDDLPSVCAEAAALMGSLLVIFVMAFGLNALLGELEVPQAAAAWVASLDLGPVAFLLVLNVLLLLVGCFMDIMSAIMILVPLLVPIAAGLGIDPIHLGIIFIVNLELGYLTPPLGLNLFVSSQIFEKPLGDVIRSVVPFAGLLLVAVVIVTYVPTVSMGPVNLLEGKPFWQPFPSPPEPSLEGADEDDDDVPSTGGAMDDLMKRAGFGDIMGDDDDDDWDDDDADGDDGD